jgi:hypothetical protein
MAGSYGRLQLRRCRSVEIGASDDGNGRAWPAGEVLLAAISRREATHYALAVPEAALEGETLTGFLERVAPFGCPVPGSLIRAYRLPDSPFPSILLKEHEAAPDGTGDAYLRFLTDARQRWLAALEETGPGLCPVLAWQAGTPRRFLAVDESADALADAGVALAGAADSYLGRGLLLLAHPELAGSWRTMMSLGGVTKIRKITGREFPVWVDLPAHQPDLLESPLLARAEALLAET